MAQITFTQQASTVNFPSPGRGAEQWHGGWDLDLTPFTKLDKYWRGQWHQFESAKDQYTFTEFDNQINEAIDRGGKFGFGIMTLCDCDLNSVLQYSGGTSSYPQYLHTLMQAESTKDTLANGQWVPNWNSQSYLTRFEALLKAINNHLETTIYKGVKYADAISYIDIRGFGQWGEWHLVGIEGTPAATSASLKRIVDAHINGFPTQRLVALIAALDGGSTGWTVFPSPADVSYYLLTAKNGEIGWRRDSLGSTETYYPMILENNSVTYNGVALKSLIMNKWKTGQVVGEPNFGVQMDALPSQVKTYHMMSFGNSNYGVTLSASSKTAIKDAALVAGYRLTVNTADVSVSGSNLSINLNWQNKGLTPTYENWDIVYELKNGPAVVWTGKSSFKLRHFLPATIGTNVSEVFSILGVPAGTYSLTFKVVDPKGYRKPLSLAITNQALDGSYSLGNIQSSGGIANQVPIANAGNDLSVKLSTNIIGLDASASKDLDGSIISYEWFQVSGPTAAFVGASNKALVNIIITTPGDYIYNVKITDDKGAIANDTVKVTVLPADPVIVTVEKIVEVPVEVIKEVEKIVNVEKPIQSVIIKYTDGTTKILI